MRRISHTEISSARCAKDKKRSRRCLKMRRQVAVCDNEYIRKIMIDIKRYLFF
jgi:hypothetical protein